MAGDKNAATKAEIPISHSHTHLAPPARRQDWGGRFVLRLGSVTASFIANLDGTNGGTFV
jgi:hypothetical protein